MPHTRAYRAGTLVAQAFPVADISEHLEREGTVIWLDLCDPTPGDLERAANEFDLHALAVEDVLEAHQRPKVDIYSGHCFLTAYAVNLDATTGELSTHEVAAFVTPKALITVRKDDGFDISAIEARWDADPALAAHGVGFLLYGLLDHVVDAHFIAVQELDEHIEELEELLFDDQPRTATLERRSFELRKSLVLLRRVVLPMREVLNTLMRRDVGVVDQEMVPYFQDIYDHVLRAHEWTESLRDLVATIRETHLTIQGNRLNLVMKKVTSWAAIIAVPTAITGFYGQNVPYPGYGAWWGFIVSTMLILLLSAGLYASFRRKDWI